MAKLAEYHNRFPALREFVNRGKPVWGSCAGLIFLANKAIDISKAFRNQFDFRNEWLDFLGQKAGGQELIGGLDCTIHRNFFGSQIQSFEAELSVPELASKERGPETFRGVFIRAPAILEVGPGVGVLADFPTSSGKVSNLYSNDETQEETTGSQKRVIVAVKQKNLLGTAFHPELTADTRWHSYFLKMASEAEERAASSSIIPVGEVDLTFDQQPRNDLPVF